MRNLLHCGLVVQLSSSTLEYLKIFGPLNIDEVFTPEDFHLVEHLLHSSATEDIQLATKDIKLQPPSSKHHKS